MSYVAHVCRSSRQPEYTTIIVSGKKIKEKNPNYCDRIWIDKDLTDAKVKPPTWKYCQECCKRLGIGYDSQTPTSNLSDKELEHHNKLSERAKSISRRTKSKINSEMTE